MNIIKRSIASAGLLIAAGLSACTEPGETTGVAAATGGVIGAGLGAIVGNQTGDTGTGLVIGAAAGATGGALVGNALEAQEQSIRAQDEAIERQEQTITAQRAEIEELRRLNPDHSTRSRLRGELSSRPLNPPLNPPQGRLIAPPPQPMARNSAPTSYSDRLYGQTGGSSAPAANTGALQERSLTAPPSFDSAEPKARPAPAAIAPAAVSETVTVECRQAAAEGDKARAASEPADRLFHYRRAIRLCPGEANYHAALGEVYLSLNRREDAQFEFKEALHLNPSHNAARQNLQTLKVSNDDNRF